MDKEITKLSISELSSLLKSGALSLQEYINTVLAHIATLEPKIHALLPEVNREERLLQNAWELLNTYPHPESRPPLFGVLVGIKDLFNVDGLPTQAGSKLPPDAFAGKEAEIVTRLKELGAIILGKTVSTEFAYFSPGETCNPVNPLHTPGGSSSGSAAAVAAGYCHLALGTQTIASIIRPASYCGVYGFKPSWGRISVEGVFPFSQSADHVGLICRSVEDIRLVSMHLLSNRQPSPKQPEFSLGCARGTYLMQADKSVRRNYEACIQRLKEQGFKIVDADPFGDIELINASHRRLIAAEFAINHRALFSQYSHLYSEHSKQLYATGLEVSISELNDLKNAQIDLRQSISKLMKDNGIDLWITPSTTTTAPLGLSSTGSPLMGLPWTNAGLPSLTIPNGFDDKGLPYGIQLIADWDKDEFLLVNSVIYP